MPETNQAPKTAPSNLAKAFKETFNLGAVGVIAVLAAVAVLVQPAAAIAVAGVGALLEAAYLAIVPNSSWFAKRLASKYDSETLQRREILKKQIYPQLRASMKARFDRLETTRRQMNDRAEDGNPRYREVVHKVDYMLEKFLQFAGKEQEFRQYLRSVLEECLQEQGAPPTAGAITSKRVTEEYLPGEPPLDPADVWVQTIVAKVQKFFDDSLQSLDRAGHDPDDLSTNAVLEKRKDVIHRRRDYVGQIGKILLNLNHQLELMEDTLGLINDEIRARTPEQVLADIEDVVYKADALMDMLDEVAPANPLPARFADTEEVKA